MELEAKLDALSDKVNKHRELLSTEEAAKTALVMPFLQALGYDVFNPAEVIPEFTCDVATKKGEKVDYAISIDGNISMLIECKPINQELSLKHASQLYRYFSVTDAKFAILTNGAAYKFYSDLDNSNRMDERPFFEFDLSKLKKTDYRHIAKFQRTGFNVDSIIETAAHLQMEGAVTKILLKEMSDPSSEMVRCIAGQIVDGRISAASKAAIAKHIPSAFKAILREKLNDRLTSAIDEGIDDESVEVSNIETTADEIEGFQIVRAIASELVDPARVFMRDSKSYCAILLDDNNRKPIARLRFNSENNKYFGTINNDKEELRNPINSTVEIYRFKESVIERLKQLMKVDA